MENDRAKPEFADQAAAGIEDEPYPLAGAAEPAEDGSVSVDRVNAPRAAILRALRRPGDEAQLTQVLAAVAGTDPAVAGRIVQLLVAKAPHPQEVCELNRVPEKLLCRPEESLRTAGGEPRGRVDLRFYTADFDFNVLVELKLGSPYGYDQVARYLDAIADLPADTPRGLLSVTRNVPGVGEPPAGEPGWLGSVRWRDVLSGLRDLNIADDLLAAEWRVWLDIMETQGDFGVTNLEARAVDGWARHVATRDDLAQVIEDLAPHVRSCLQGALSARAAWRGYAPGGIAEFVFRSNERKASYLTQGTVQLRLRVPAADGVHPRIVVQFLGGFDRPFFTVEARRPGAARLLADSTLPGHRKFRDAAKTLGSPELDFKANPSDSRGYYARLHEMSEWLTDDLVDPEKLLTIAREDLTTLAGSGILDPDAGFVVDDEGKV